MGIASRYSAGIGRRISAWLPLVLNSSILLVIHLEGPAELYRQLWLALCRPVTGPNEVNHLTPVNFNCDCNTFAPQFGFAWQIQGAGVIRAAYGLQFGDIYAQTLQQVRRDPLNFLKSAKCRRLPRSSLRRRIFISGPALSTLNLMCRRTSNRLIRTNTLFCGSHCKESPGRSNSAIPARVLTSCS